MQREAAAQAEAVRRAALTATQRDTEDKAKAEADADKAKAAADEKLRKEKDSLAYRRAQSLYYTLYEAAHDPSLIEVSDAFYTDAGVIAIEYRAKNAFGALVQQVTIVAPDGKVIAGSPQNRKVAQTWNRHIAKTHVYQLPRTYWPLAPGGRNRRNAPRRRIPHCHAKKTVAAAFALHIQCTRLARKPRQCWPLAPIHHRRDAEAPRADRMAAVAFGFQGARRGAVRLRSGDPQWCRIPAFPGVDLRRGGGQNERPAKQASRIHRNLKGNNARWKLDEKAIGEGYSFHPVYGIRLSRSFRMISGASLTTKCSSDKLRDCPTRPTSMAMTR